MKTKYHIRKKYVALLCGTLLTLSSCNSFLDIKPYGKTIPESPEEFSALLNDILAGIDGSSFPSTKSQDLFFDHGMVSDIEECSDNLETNLTQYPKGGYLLFYPGNMVSSQHYQNYYAVISRCNMILDNFKEGRDSQDGRNLVGTAYALRGVAYYQLLRLYCEPPTGDATRPGVPIVTTFDMEERPIRSSYAQTVEQAESDFKAALECHITDSLYRFNDDVVKACLARLYFWSGHYEEAKNMADDVLTRHPLLAGEDYKKMMTAQDGMAGNMLLRSNRILSADDATLASYLEARPFSIRFLKLFAEKDKDIRYRLFVGKGRTNNKLFFSGLRSAELALIAMESCYHLGQTDEALKRLNDFRSKRIDDYVPYTAATLPHVDEKAYVKSDCKGNALTPLIAAILNERRKELYLEGDRFFELKRNGRPEFWVMHNGLKYTAKAFMYTFPIPASDVQLNPAIVQNPGYEELVY